MYVNELGETPLWAISSNSQRAASKFPTLQYPATREVLGDGRRRQNPRQQGVEDEPSFGGAVRGGELVDEAAVDGEGGGLYEGVSVV